ncbi:hypothetical protein KLP28_08565 [Nocardioidaceae bacterium]|nr:hypothetical protein KLP28_08565 [Nocardioidaceae bacterium]
MATRMRITPEQQARALQEALRSPRGVTIKLTTGQKRALAQASRDGAAKKDITALRRRTASS